MGARIIGATLRLRSGHAFSLWPFFAMILCIIPPSAIRNPKFTIYLTMFFIIKIGGKRMTIPPDLNSFRLNIQNTKCEIQNLFIRAVALFAL